MKFQKQLFRHDPDNGVYGDCARTVYACFFDLRPEEVPHFAPIYWEDPIGWGRAVTAWLNEQGCTRINVAYDGSQPGQLEAVHKYARAINPDLYYMLTGRSKNGVDHVVICLNGEVVWDPALDDSGIVGPAGDGNYWLEWLASNRFSVRTEANHG